MSQMPQQAAVPKCPSCEEPLESGDRFCGACGYDLSVVPARPEDSPTLAINGAVPAPDGVDWPVARDSDGHGHPEGLDIMAPSTADGARTCLRAPRFAGAGGAQGTSSTG